MKTLLAISPHLDDAIFSAGALLWSFRRRGWRVVIATVFTGNVKRPSGFALACQLDKDLQANVDYMELRRLEDRQACATLDAEPLHLPLLEAPHRGYPNAAALFNPVLPNDQVEGQVRAALTTVLAATRPDVVLAPSAIGSHVDHKIMRSAAEAIAGSQRLWLWEDWPYVDRSSSIDRRGAHHLLLSADACEAKVRACGCYVTQLGFQFGDAQALAAHLHGQEREWFKRA